MADGRYPARPTGSRDRGQTRVADDCGDPEGSRQTASLRRPNETQTRRRHRGRDRGIPWPVKVTRDDRASQGGINEKPEPAVPGTAHREPRTSTVAAGGLLRLLGNDLNATLRGARRLQ